MNFRFHIGKATEAASAFLQHAGGTLSIMKLIKLMYLLDRLSLDRRNMPVVGGDYLSMRNGPVTSEILDLINSGRLADEPDARWSECIGDRRNHDVHLDKVPERWHVSDVELDFINEIWATHGHMDQWELRDWCHTHCGEWTPLNRGCAPIAVERIGQVLGKAPHQIEKLKSEVAELNLLDQIFSMA